MSEETIPEIEDCEAERQWAYFDDCGELPMGLVVLFYITGAWLILFVGAFIRLTYLSRSSLNDTTVSKRMQFAQAWFYSYIHSIVDLSAIFLAVALAEDGEYITASFIGVFVLLATALTSQVDVIGTDSKKQGSNNVDFLVVLQYFIHSYLVKAVWKMTGHNEYGRSAKDEVKVNALENLCCMQNVYNSKTPRVYDFKDVVGIQGAYLSLPVLFGLLLTLVRSNGVASIREVEVETDGEVEVIVEEALDELYFNPLLYATAAIAFVSAVGTPLLGDWETFSKNILMCLGSLVFRSLEVVARLGFYVYFVDFSKFGALGMLAGEFVFMWLTGIQLVGVSSAGRTSSPSHKLLATWESVFFTNYRRVHVDKEFHEQNFTLMPTTIEFIRFIARTTATTIGYLVMVGKDIPESYTEAVDEMLSLPILFFAGVAANVFVVVFNLFNFLIWNRKEMSTSDCGKLKSYWQTLPVLSFFLTPKTVHVNRDNANFHAGGDPIHYI